MPLQRFQVMNKREIEGEGERDDRDRDRKEGWGGCVVRFPCITQQLDCVTRVYSLCWWRWGPLFSLHAHKTCTHTMARQYTDANAHPQVHTQHRNGDDSFPQTHSPRTEIFNTLNTYIHRHTCIHWYTYTSSQHYLLISDHTGINYIRWQLISDLVSQVLVTLGNERKKYTVLPYFHPSIS